MGRPADERLSPAVFLAAVKANLTANGVTDHSGAWTPATCPLPDQEGCATLPIYLKTATGDVTAGGSKWIKLGTGPITFSAARLTDPATFAVDVPPSIGTDLQSRLLSVTSIIVMLVVGVLAYLMEENDIPVAPAVLGLVMGTLLERNLITSLIKGDNSIAPFFERPIAACLGVLTLALWFTPVLIKLYKKAHRKEAAV